MTLFNLKSKLRQQGVVGGIAAAAMMTAASPAFADIAIEQMTNTKIRKLNELSKLLEEEKSK